LYGCGCGVVPKYKFLKTYTKMMFFWNPISTIKCSGVPFTHICEWKSPSSSSGSSSGWIVAVATVAVGYASMIYLLLLFYESGFKSFSLSSATNGCIK
jgi:hypothetical protein